jgi:3-oxoacyl-[acyl-carrier-protein] synthase-3
MDAYIKAISYYLPEKFISNEDLVIDFPEWSVDKIAGKIGIKNRHIAADDEFVSDMAVKAAQKLFAEHNISPSQIDYILLCTQSPDYFFPTTACLVQDRLNIPTTAGAIDFNQGCSGYIYGLTLAKGLILGDIAKNVLLITSETYSKHINKGDKGNRTIFGDAASATLVSTDGISSIENFALGTDGKGGENLIVKNGGVKNPHRTNKTTEDEFGNVISDDHLFMNGAAIFNFTIESVPKLVAQTLEKNNLQANEVDFYIFHQANRYMLNHLRKKIGIDDARFLIHMEDCGNTVSSTIPIVLKEALKKQTFKTENKILLAGFGVGYSWGGCIIKFV